MGLDTLRREERQPGGGKVLRKLLQELSQGSQELLPSTALPQCLFP